MANRTLEQEAVSAVVKRRIEIGLSQNGLARRAGLDKGHLSLIVNGHRGLTLQMLEALAAEMGCKVSIKLVPKE